MNEESRSASWRREVARLWRAAVRVLGESWVFWPSLLVVGVLRSGPSRWPAPWMWAVALLLAGPVLALAIWRVSSRRTGPRPAPRVLGRLVQHLRGPNA